MSAMIVKSVRVTMSASVRADAGRRQRRQDRQRMHDALVEDAEHDVHRRERRQQQPGFARERCLERLRGALKAAVHGRGHADVASGLLDGVDGIAERRARQQVERERDGRKLRLVVHGQSGARVGRNVASVETAPACRAVGHVDGLERLRMLPVFGRDFHHHPVLVQALVHRRDLTLAEGVVEGIVDGCGADAEPCRRVAIDGHDRALQAAVLLIAVHIGDQRLPSQTRGETRGPVVQQRRGCRPEACIDTARWPSARRRECPARPAGTRWRADRGRIAGLSRAITSSAGSRVCQRLQRDEEPRLIGRRRRRR